MKLKFKGFAKLTLREYLIASPGVFLVVLGGLGLDHAWPYAFWVAVAGFAYQPIALLYLMRKPKPKAEVMA